MTTDYEPDPARPTAPVCVVIPTHPARGHVGDPRTLLGQAVASVRAQTLQPLALSIACDLDGDGAAVTRQRALDQVDETATPWVSFVDSDDLLRPPHLETHWRLLQESGADVAYSWFDGNQPFGAQGEFTHRGKVFDPAAPHHITMTLTVRTSLAKAAGFLGDPLHPDWAGEDWRHVMRLIDLGARFVGTGEITWHYRISHGLNTSGFPDRGDGPIAMPVRGANR